MNYVKVIISDMASDWIFYVLITLCLAFVGISAMQFLYVFYLERLTNDHKKYIKELEHRVIYLNERLFESELELKYGDQTLNSEFIKDEDWIDVLED